MFNRHIKKKTKTKAQRQAVTHSAQSHRDDVEPGFSHFSLSLSRVQLFATPQTVAYQAPLAMGVSKQQHWSGLSFPSPGDLPNLGLEPWSPAGQDKLKKHMTKYKIDSQWEFAVRHRELLSVVKIIIIIIIIF